MLHACSLIHQQPLRPYLGSPQGEEGHIIKSEQTTIAVRDSEKSKLLILAFQRREIER